MSHSHSSPEEELPIVAHVLVVAFHHQLGPIVEFAQPPLPCYPEDEEMHTEAGFPKVPKEWVFLPFLALPDGAHQSEQQICYFHLPPLRRNTEYPFLNMTLFGISCFRQIEASKVKNRTADITRATVQKAVVVITRQAVVGSVRDQLTAVTAAYFNQGDFTQKEIIVQFYESLSAKFHTGVSSSALYLGISLQELVRKFKSKTLVLFKLLLLEKRVMFYGHPVESLCAFQYALVSLIPGLLGHLQDCGSADRVATSKKRAFHDFSDERQVFFEKMALPLDIFNEGSFFQPYFPLQQLDIIETDETRSFLIGTSNAVLKMLHRNVIDVVVDIEKGSISFNDQDIAEMVELTSSDKRFMDEIIQSVNHTYDKNAPEYEGSDEYIRGKFENYLLAFLSSVYYAEMGDEHGSFELVSVTDGTEKIQIKEFNESWVNHWIDTRNYEIWKSQMVPEYISIIEPRHPGQGGSAINDMQRKISNSLSDLHLDFTGTIAKAVSSGSGRFSKAVEGLYDRHSSASGSETSSMREETETLDSQFSFSTLGSLFNKKDASEKSQETTEERK
ncbi:hypothetical protein K493DRAFT_312539 [Basidiobolus meristosporus CBS 931.73]|uniref:UDENN domain-containing protein n=1 Tax=Basidiobolus meristosporus CBS 931.73 TaxID=1314790 RepID=A0A1Y1YT59_9FUNG|nr:hypothetical protein K493DRAFT_312539 [Basidiobolus meristosporus CBS 931.73]|eukprot:ORY01139.1 hypothetical protein K493DRAFT_312539 [Basidiobolus meristosporus CBS 931.73]